MTGGDNGDTMPITPPANTPLPPTLLISDVNDLTPAQRLPALTATQNTDGNGVTQSAQTQDSVSAVANSAGLDFYVNNEGATVAIRVDNSNPDADWTTNPPSLLLTSYIFGSGSFASKALADYENGDFYTVTGFWYRNPTDFGVFVDGSPIDLNTNPLPTTGSATYRGAMGGYIWNSEGRRENLSGTSFLEASFVGGNMVMGGIINAPDAPVITGILQVNLQNITDDDGDGVFTGGSITCSLGCLDRDPTGSSWGGRFVGNPVDNGAGGPSSNEWPAGFVGVFGIQEGSEGAFDAIGTFGAIHEDLCAATASDDSAAFCTKPTTP